PSLQHAQPEAVRRNRAQVRAGTRVPRRCRPLHRRLREPARHGFGGRRQRRDGGELPRLGNRQGLPDARPRERPDRIAGHGWSTSGGPLGPPFSLARQIGVMANRDTMELQRPYLLFLGDVPDSLAAKTALGIVDWRRDWCVGQLRLEGCKADTGLPDMTVAEAAAAGARTMIVGVVNPGGVLPDHWIDTIVAALDSGLDVATGLHRRLGSVPAIAAAAERNGRALHDVRFSDRQFSTGKGTKRPGKRLLTVGTDCSVGKKYAALALEREMRARGLDAEFRATGQTGIFISGRGVAVDAVVADFISGAAEWL